VDPRVPQSRRRLRVRARARVVVRRPPVNVEPAGRGQPVRDVVPLALPRVRRRLARAA
jgi:hypothetical protein